MIGCGGGPTDQPELGTVSGVVKADGSPLANVVVTFTPSTGRPSVGRTGTDGTYSLDFTADTKGAAIGTHTVTVSLAPSDSYESGAADKKEETKLPKSASDGSIQKEVKAGDNAIDIDL